MLTELTGLPFTTYSWLMFIGATFTLGLGLYSLRQRSSQVGFWFSWLCFAESFYIFGYGMELACNAAAQINFWLTFEMLGGAFLPALVILMTYSYRYHSRAPLWLTTFLFSLSALTLAIRFGDESHQLIFKSVAWVLDDGMSISVLEFGPWFYIYMVYVNFAMVICTSLFYQCWRSAPTQQKNQVLLVLLGSLPPWLAYVIYVLNLAPHNLDLSAFGFLLSSPLYAYSLVRYQFADLLPIAQSHILNSIDEVIIVVDTQWRIIDSNHQAQRLFAIHPIHTPQQCPISLASLAQQGMTVDNHPRQQMQHNQRTYDLQCHPLRENATLLGYVLMLRDITERTQQLNLLKNHAEIDDLTGILNRRMILQQLELFAQQQWNASNQADFGVILFDIDRFKQINDHQGHVVGDLMLKQLTGLLQQQMQHNEIFGRYGGDEFLILVTNITPAELEARAEYLRLLANSQLGITLSMGLTHYQRHDTPRLMLQRADYALYQAKSAGRDRVHSMQEALIDNMPVIGLR